MSKVVLDEELRSKLNGLTEETELCDEQGRTVGHFVPADLYKEFLLAVSRARSSDEELEQLRKEPGGRPLGEIWKALGRK